MRLFVSAAAREISRASRWRESGASSRVPPSLINNLRGCTLNESGRFRVSEREIHVLDRLAGGAFAQVVDYGNHDGAASFLVVLESDVAEVGVRNRMQIGNLPGCVQTDERLGRVALAIDRQQIVRGGDFFGRAEVDRLQNSAVDRN